LAAMSLRDHGHFADAYHLYQRLARDLQDPELVLEARVNCFVLAQELPGFDPGDHRRLLQDALETPGGEGLASPMIALRTESLWVDARFNQALELLLEHEQLEPQSRLALDLLSQRPASLPVPVRDRLLEHVARCPDVSYLDLSGLDLEQIDWVAELPLRSLVCNRNRLTALPDLSGGNLAVLDCSANPLTRLPNLPLSLLRLNADQCALGSLEQLAGLSLEHLSINDNDISDITPLRGMSLRELRLSGNSIGDLSPLRDMPLSRLIASDNDIDHIDILAGMPLRALQVANNTISDLGALAGLPLRSLQVSGNPITGLGAIDGAPLQILHADATALTDNLALNLSSLHSLRLSQTAISSLHGLFAPELQDLRLNGTAVRELTPKAFPLLRTLQTRRTSLTDPMPLLELPLREWRCLHDGMDDALFARLLDQADPELRPRLREEWHLARARRGDWQWLSEATEHFGSSTYVFLPAQATYAESRKLAEAAGGQVVCIETADEDRWLQDLLRRHRSVSTWIGLEADRWINGAPAHYRNMSPVQADRNGAWHLFVQGSHARWSRGRDQTAQADLVIELPLAQ
ncbi:MAG: leucine-rich repeat domain-containing protein, partial [Planctomycetota bacterium]